MEYLLNTPSGDKWKRAGLKKRAGVLIPLFSVYSRNSIGVGDFSDLKILADWLHSTGNSILQLLPMNEMGSVFCPYDAVSSFALEPAFISLKSVPAASSRGIRIEIENLARNFPTGKPYVDYGIKSEKQRLLWAMYLAWDHRDSGEFKRFKEENSYWLIDFALYKSLKRHFNGLAWWDWEYKFRNRDVGTLEKFSFEQEKEIDYHMWVQWQLFRQFRAAGEYARSKGVLLKGDLPILVSRDSADVWARPDYFKLEFAAGAPADMYCAKGQRWGMPTYNWEKISSGDYIYLKEKLKYAQNFYDILRIDHVVGLFRIWSIPYSDAPENQGLRGFFDPQDESKWGEHGRKLLSVHLEGTHMLLCAEDLGVIPRVCFDTLKELGIPGNDVQRWVKDWNVRHDFLAPQEYRQLSVAMLSTHDTTNWPAWWENEAGTVDEALFERRCGERGIDFIRVKPELFDLSLSRHGRLRWKPDIDSPDKLCWVLGKRREEVADFIEMYLNTYCEKEKLWRLLGLKGPMREKSDKELVQAVLRSVLGSKAAFSVNSVFDLLYLSDILKNDPYQYRINTPGTISPQNWSLTLPLPLEELLKHKLNKEIRSLNSASGRI
ncbi:MAG: 4-alpha-glucanotransferase [Candidatus Omnitrophica bacterium]|nr:4-alpha-glucanotransferase [Candidatus Omnitrophota bacterium]